MNSRFKSRVVPTRRAMSAASANSKSHVSQEHGSSSRNDPGLEAYVHFTSLTRWGLYFLSASLFRKLLLCVTDRLLVLIKRFSSGR